MDYAKNRELAADGHEDREVSDYSKLPAAPLVSVCMITYQHAGFIREALDSVLMQMVGFPYEICLGEDGSTDGTREICLEYARKHPDRIRLFLRNRSNPDRSQFKMPYMFNSSATFNACRGKYIALLEGDDYWLHANKLEAQVRELEADPALAAVCHYALTASELKTWAARVIPTYPVSAVSIEEILTREIVNLHTSTWLLRRGQPLPWAFFQKSSFGDYPIFVWTMLQGPARVLPAIMSLYRQHGLGVFSQLASVDRLQANVELWKCLESIVPPGLQSAHLTGVIRTHIMHTSALIKSFRMGRALVSFKQTLADIARKSSPAERWRWRLFAFAALLLPHLQGLRNRWWEWRRKKSFRTQP